MIQRKIIANILYS